jgi:hypothetical protein
MILISTADDLDQHPLPPPAVKFAVEDPLPGAKIEPAVGHRNHNFAAHHLPLQVRVCIVLASAIVLVLADGRVGSQSPQPLFIVLMQAVFIVVDEHTRSNVHRIYKGQSPLSHIPPSSP